MPKTWLREMADDAHAAADGIERVAEALPKVGDAAQSVKLAAQDAARGPITEPQSAGDSFQYNNGNTGAGAGFGNTSNGNFNPTSVTTPGGPGSNVGVTGGSHSFAGITSYIAHNSGGPTPVPWGTPESVIGIVLHGTFIPGSPVLSDSGGLIGVIGIDGADLLALLKGSDSGTGNRRNSPSVRGSLPSGGAGHGTGGGTSPAPPASPSGGGGGGGGTFTTKSPDVVDAINRLSDRLDRQLPLGTLTRMR